MTAVFSHWALSYWARGFSPIPILAGTKAPGFAGRYLAGSNTARMRRTKVQLAAWAQDKTCGLAVCTGYSGLIAVDVDSLKANAAVKSVLGGMGAPVKIGQRGCTAFFRDPSGETRSSDFRAAPVIGPDGKRHQETLVQILAAGRETVLPPTVHPDTGKPYYWHHRSLENCRIDDLPIITPGHLGALAAALAPFMPEGVPLLLRRQDKRRTASWATSNANATRLYRYTPDRKGERCRSHLAAFKGHLHADGYPGFADAPCAGVRGLAVRFPGARREPRPVSYLRLP